MKRKLFEVIAISPENVTFLVTLAPLALVASSIYLVARSERSSYVRGQS
jgi:hypothetical protein